MAKLMVCAFGIMMAIYYVVNVIMIIMNAFLNTLHIGVSPSVGILLWKMWILVKYA